MNCDPKEPRSFSDMSDNPTNTGWVGNEYEWEEIRPTNRQRHPDLDDPSEDIWYEDDEWEGDSML